MENAFVVIFQCWIIVGELHIIVARTFGPWQSTTILRDTLGIVYEFVAKLGATQ
jgi:hypothetical protein